MTSDRIFQFVILAMLLIALVASSYAITDRFSSNAGSIMSSAIHAEVLTPNDSADLDYVTRALYVGGTGNIKVTMQGGETLIITAVQVGTMLPVRVTRVWATDTTATNIVAFD